MVDRRYETNNHAHRNISIFESLGKMKIPKRIVIAYFYVVIIVCENLRANFGRILEDEK